MSNLQFLELEQGSKAWIEYRRTRVGASEIASVMGIDPWRTPLQLYEQKLFGHTIAENEDMARGRRLEPVVREMINKKYFTDYNPIVVENAKYPFGFASLDGWDEKAYVPVIEIKCPRKHADVLPKHYLYQIQFQLMITEADVALFVSYDGEEIIEQIVKRDSGIIAQCEAEGAAFWARLKDFDPPPPCDKDYVEISDPEAILAAARLATIKKEIAFLEMQEKGIEETLKQACSGRSAKFGDHKFTCYTKKGTIDYARVPELEGINLEPYRKKPSVCWRFS